MRSYGSETQCKQQPTNPTTQSIWYKVLHPKLDKCRNCRKPALRCCALAEPTQAPQVVTLDAPASGSESDSRRRSHSDGSSRSGLATRRSIRNLRAAIQPRTTLLPPNVPPPNPNYTQSALLVEQAAGLLLNVVAQQSSIIIEDSNYLLDDPQSPQSGSSSPPVHQRLQKPPPSSQSSSSASRTAETLPQPTPQDLADAVAQLERMLALSPSTQISTSQGSVLESKRLRRKQPAEQKQSKESAPNAPADPPPQKQVPQDSGLAVSAVVELAGLAVPLSTTNGSASAVQVTHTQQPNITASQAGASQSSLAERKPHHSHQVNVSSLTWPPRLPVNQASPEHVVAYAQMCHHWIGILTVFKRYEQHVNHKASLIMLHRLATMSQQPHFWYTPRRTSANLKAMNPQQQKQHVNSIRHFKRQFFRFWRQLAMHSLRVAPDTLRPSQAARLAHMLVLMQTHVLKSPTCMGPSRVFGIPQLYETSSQMLLTRSVDSLQHPSATAEQLSNLILNIAKLKLTPSEAWVRNFLAATKPHLKDCSSKQCAALAYGVGQLQIKPPQSWLADLYMISQAQMPSMTAKDLTLLSWGITRLPRRPPPGWMERFLQTCASQLENFDAPAYATVAHALGRLRFKPPRQWVTAFLDGTGILMDDFQPQELSLLMRGLAFLGVVPDDYWLEDFYSHSEPQLGDFHPSQFANLGFALGIMGVRPPPAWLEEYRKQAAYCLGAQGRARGKMDAYHKRRLLFALAAFRTRNLKSWYERTGLVQDEYLEGYAWGRDLLAVLKARQARRRSLNASSQQMADGRATWGVNRLPPTSLASRPGPAGPAWGRGNAGSEGAEGGSAAQPQVQLRQARPRLADAFEEALLASSDSYDL